MSGSRRRFWSDRWSSDGSRRVPRPRRLSCETEIRRRGRRLAFLRPRIPQSEEESSAPTWRRFDLRQVPRAEREQALRISPSWPARHRFARFAAPGLPKQPPKPHVFYTRVPRSSATRKQMSSALTKLSQTGTVRSVFGVFAFLVRSARWPTSLTATRAVPTFRVRPTSFKCGPLASSRSPAATLRRQADG